MRTFMVAVCAMSLSAHAKVVPLMRLTAEERYNEAPFLGTTSSAGGQMLSRFSAQPGFRVEQPTLRITGAYAADFLMRHGSGTFGLDHRGQLSLQKAFSRRHRLELQLGLWRVRDPTSLPRVGLARNWLPIAYGRGDARFVVELSPRIRTSVGYRFEGAQILESTQLPGLYHAPAVSLDWSVSRRTTLQGEGRVQLFSEGRQSALGQGVLLSVRHLWNRSLSSAFGGGPLYFADAQNRGVLPRLLASLRGDWPMLELELSAGQDLVGASGFASALWAQYLVVNASWGLNRHLRLSGAISLYRNGQAPSQGMWPQGTAVPGTSQGYLAGVSFEWRLLPTLLAVATVDRFEQLDGFSSELPTAWNLAGVRLSWTPWGDF